MRKVLCLICCAGLLLVAGCGPAGNADSANNTGTPITPTPVPSQPAPDDSDPARDTLSLSAFLTEEQQALYFQALDAYNQFAATTDGFGSTRTDDTPTMEYDGATYYLCNGAYTTWAQFEEGMLALFTPECLEALNHSAVRPLPDGTYTPYLSFIQGEEGKLYYAWGIAALDPEPASTDGFQLLSQTDDRIEFELVTQYNVMVGTLAGDDAHTMQSGESYKEKQLSLIMVNTPDGWRFSRINASYFAVADALASSGA